MSKNISIESLRLLRDKAHENVRNFCRANNEDFKEGLKYITEIADKKTFMAEPGRFYIELYNQSIELLNR